MTAGEGLGRNTVRSGLGGIGGYEGSKSGVYSLGDDVSQSQKILYRYRIPALPSVVRLLRDARVTVGVEAAILTNTGIIHESVSGAMTTDAATYAADKHELHPRQQLPTMMTRA